MWTMVYFDENYVFWWYYENCFTRFMVYFMITFYNGFCYSNFYICRGFFNFDDFLCWNDKDRNFEFGLVVQNLN